MRTVLRYPLDIDLLDSLDRTVTLTTAPLADGLPDTAAGRSGIVHVASRSASIVELWVQVDTDAEQSDMRLAVTGTGKPVPEGAEHLGTVLDRQYVWHLWRLP